MSAIFICNSYDIYQLKSIGPPPGYYSYLSVLSIHINQHNHGLFVAPVSHCEKHNRYITRIEAEKARRQDDCLQEVMTDRQSERSTSSLKPGDGVPGAFLLRRF